MGIQNLKLLSYHRHFRILKNTSRNTYCIDFLVYLKESKVIVQYFYFDSLKKAVFTGRFDVGTEF